MKKPLFFKYESEVQYESEIILSNESLCSIFASIREVVFSSNAPLIPNPVAKLFVHFKYSIDSCVWSKTLVKLKSELYIPRFNALAVTVEYFETFSIGFKYFGLYFAPAPFNISVASTGPGIVLNTF